MNIDLTPIFQAVVALLAAIITFRVIPWIKARTNEKQQANLLAAARSAVFAAEQIYGANNGDVKLNYALDLLEDRGYHLDRDVLRSVVEDCVKAFMGDEPKHGERGTIEQGALELKRCTNDKPPDAED